MTFDRTPIRSERVPHIDGSFAAIPHRFLRDGFFASLDEHELRLYLLLALVADRQGLSFYRDERLARLLGLALDEFHAARAGLLRKDLVAHDGSRYQILSLPPRPVPPPSPRRPEPQAGPIHIGQALRDLLSHLDEPNRR